MQDPWVGKIPWRRKWQPTPGVLPRESLGQRSLAVHRVTKYQTGLKRLSAHSPHENPVERWLSWEKIFCCLLNSSNPWITENVALYKGKGGHERNPLTVQKTTWGCSRDPGLPASCFPWSSFSNLCPFLQGWEPAAGKNHKSPLQCSLALQGQEFRDFNNTTAIALNPFRKWNIWRAITVKWDLPSNKESKIKRIYY